jgi:hypothetical protein
MVSTRGRNSGVADPAKKPAASAREERARKRPMDPVLLTDEEEPAPKRFYGPEQSGVGWAVTQVACTCKEGEVDPECTVCVVPAKHWSRGPAGERRETVAPKRWAGCMRMRVMQHDCCRYTDQRPADHKRQPKASKRQPKASGGEPSSDSDDESISLALKEVEATAQSIAAAAAKKGAIILNKNCLGVSNIVFSAAKTATSNKKATSNNKEGDCEPLEVLQQGCCNTSHNVCLTFGL